MAPTDGATSILTGLKLLLRVGEVSRSDQVKQKKNVLGVEEDPVFCQNVEYLLQPPLLFKMFPYIIAEQAFQHQCVNLHREHKSRRSCLHYVHTAPRLNTG